MKRYRYRAIDELGRSRRGTRLATDETDLEHRLARDNLTLLGCRPQSPGTRRAACRQELPAFFFQLEHLQRAGIPLLDSLADLRDSTPDGEFRARLSDLLAALHGGCSLSQAMAEQPDLFDALTLHLIRAGEASGQLEEIFGRLATTLRWHAELARQTRSLMLYPAFSAVMITLAAAFLLGYVLPQLGDFLQRSGLDLPWQTRALLGLSDWVRQYWPVLLLLPPAAFATLQAVRARSPHLQETLDALRLQLWLAGPLWRKLILARFASTFALLYGAGLSVLECLMHCRDSAGNRVFARELDTIRLRVEAGDTLTRSFQLSPWFPPLVIRMLKIGEGSGALDQALLHVSELYEHDARDTLFRMQRLLEPVLTLVLGLFLGWIMLAVVGPIYTLIEGGRF